MKLRVMNTGFTLIELMAVVIIVAVLLAIGLPAYQDQILRGHRAAAKAELLEIANRQEQYLLSNRTYTDNIADLAWDPPGELTSKYQLFDLNTNNGGSTVPAFYVEFEAIGSQADDGNLSIDSTGERLPADKWKR